jgi:hypothetical protein
VALAAHAVADLTRERLGSSPDGQATKRGQYSNCKDAFHFECSLSIVDLSFSKI